MSVPTKDPVLLRRDHEARTGCRENMRVLGFRCMRSSKATGEPTLFESAPYGGKNWRVVRTINKQWRVTQLVQGFRYPTERKADAPLFPSPVAAALWLEVEVANGTVRFLPAGPY